VVSKLPELVRALPVLGSAVATPGSTLPKVVRPLAKMVRQLREVGSAFAVGGQSSCLTWSKFVPEVGRCLAFCSRSA